MERLKPRSWLKSAKPLTRLNQMREEEGRGIDRELRERMAHLRRAGKTYSSTAMPSCKITPNGCNRVCRNCWAQPSTQSAFCRKRRCWSIAATFRKRWCACETHVQHFLGLLDAGGEDRQETRLSTAGDEPRSQHAAVENLGPGRRSAENHRSGIGHEVGNRKGARAGTKPRMSARNPVSSSRRRRAPASHAGQ